MNLIKTACLFCLFVILGGCLSQEQPLKVAISPWIGYEPIYQAEEFGWLGKDIELVKGEIPSESFRKILNGEVDAAALTMEDVLLARTKGVELKIIAVLDISAGGDVVLSKEKLDTLAGLKGKRIGSENSALAALMLIKTLQRAGLDHQDVTVLDIAPPKQLKAWEKNEADAVITYEPYASELLSAGAHYAISSKEFPEMIFDVLAVRSDRVEGHRSGLKKLLQAHFRALGYFHTNYKDTLYRIAAREGNSVEDIKRALGGVVLPSRQANKAFFIEDSNLYRAAEMLNTLMLEKGFIVSKDPLDSFTDPVFLKE